MRYLLNTLLALLPLYAFTQDYLDCSQALEICSKGNLHFGLASGPGELNELGNLSCYPGAAQEFAPTWISWEIAQGGTLEFVLTPDEGQAIWIRPNSLVARQATTIFWHRWKPMPGRPM